MGSNSTVSSARRSGKRRLLAPSQKYEMFVSVLTGQYTQREAAEKWKVDRTTVATGFGADDRCPLAQLLEPPFI